MNQPHRHPALLRLRRRRQTLRGSWRITGSNSTLTSISISPAPERDADEGLLAFLDLELDGLMRVDGVALRLTQAGSLALSFPSRTSRRGTRHALVRPTDRAARHAIEKAIFAALGIREEATR
ncbi:MAG: septation protein SpoVG family protein [Planctomycetes bacterium]|nr:septation protein SpoVG family protein [Planctomycetota bacterium]